MPQRRSKSWVSKTDLTRYVRCPYSFWLLDKGEISFEDTVDEAQLELVRGGVDFERVVKEPMVKLDVPPEDIPALLGAGMTIYGVPGFENPKLKILGRPDGVSGADGAMVPIEIKSHKSVQRLDEVELAFYWLLLEPQRTRQLETPLGHLVLRRDGRFEMVDVPLRPHRFNEVRRLLGEVRDARRRGVKPRVCGCNVCKLVRRDEVREAVNANQDLTLIFGIGRRYATVLEQLGYPTWESLLACNSEQVSTQLKEQSCFVSSAEIDRWKRHASSYKRGEPLVFGEQFPFGDSYIVLDLEYTSVDLGEGVPRIWLIGALVVQGDQRELVQLWADDVQEEKG